MIFLLLFSYMLSAHLPPACTNQANESHALTQNPQPKRSLKCSTTSKWLVGLLALSAAGLAFDSSTIAYATNLNNEVSPITAYPCTNDACPFIDDDREQKVGCTYSEYENGFIPPLYVKGNCRCFRGKGCHCTIEKCPPAEQYIGHFKTQLGCQITSLCTRILSIVTLGSWGLNRYSNRNAR